MPRTSPSELTISVTTRPQPPWRLTRRRNAESVMPAIGAMAKGDGKRHEIVDGEHYVTPSPFTKHQTVSMNLTKIFVRYLDRHPIGYLLAAPMDVVFSDFDVVEPDLLFVSRERRAVITDKHVMGAPDLVIEIVSAATRK